MIRLLSSMKSLKSLAKPLLVTNFQCYYDQQIATFFWGTQQLFVCVYIASSDMLCFAKAVTLTLQRHSQQGCSLPAHSEVGSLTNTLEAHLHHQHSGFQESKYFFELAKSRPYHRFYAATEEPLHHGETL